MLGKEEPREERRQEPSRPEGQLSPTGLPWPAPQDHKPWPGELTSAGRVPHHRPFVTRGRRGRAAASSRRRPGSSRRQPLAAPGLPRTLPVKGRSSAGRAPASSLSPTARRRQAWPGL